MREPPKRRTSSSDVVVPAAATLPRGWASSTVECLAADERGALTDGPFGSNLKSDHYTDVGPRVIRLQNIGDGVFLDAEAHISGEHFQTLRKHEACTGDVVIAMLGEQLPRACLVPTTLGPAIVKADCVRLRVHAEVATPAYIMMGLNSQELRQQATELMHGVGRPRLGLQWLRGLHFPIAPLSEQRRIVDALESYFTRLDDAVATLERVERNIKRYRASVLKSAVEGRLVPTEAALARQEGRAYEPAPVLLERILSERRRGWSESGKKGKYQEPTPPDTTNLPKLPEGWCWASMDQLLVWIEAGKSFRCEERPPHADEIGVVKVSAVSWGRFQEHESKTCNRAELVNEDLLIRPGDFLLSRANTVELVGACVIVGSVSRRIMLSDKILRMHTAGGLEWWLLWVLRSSLGRLQIEALATGNQDSMRNIGQAAIGRICIPLPPEVECRRIYTEIEDQLSMAEGAERITNGSRTRSARLRQSILKWAFEGKLADQDPTDEPASILLERIKAERTQPARTAPQQRKAAKKG